MQHIDEIINLIKASKDLQKMLETKLIKKNGNLMKKILILLN